MDWTKGFSLIAFFLTINSLPINTQSSELPVLTTVSDHGNFKIIKYNSENVFQCNITGKMPPNSVFKWFKNEQIIEIKPDDRIKVDNNKLLIQQTNEDDIANYSCALFDESNNSEIIRSSPVVAVGKPLSKVVVRDNPVDEGGTIHLECVVYGKPTPLIRWKKNNADITPTPDGRIKITNSPKNVQDAVLDIEKVVMSDRGEYMCSAQNVLSDIISETESSVVIRVKDKLAALWPFIGICAEVFLLCTIIFIYERKRNKAELDESDTDQSPEQKNTPDHGKESVRQRK